MSRSILEHLPDLSDASFHIPTVGGSWDDLLLTKDDDFLKDMDMSLDIQVEHHEPLTLSDLTPKPIRKARASPPTRPTRPLLPESDTSRKPPAPQQQQRHRPRSKKKPVATFQTQTYPDRPPVRDEEPRSQATSGEASRRKVEKLINKDDSPASGSKPTEVILTRGRGRPERPDTSAKTKFEHVSLDLPEIRPTPNMFMNHQEYQRQPRLERSKRQCQILGSHAGSQYHRSITRAFFSRDGSHQG